MLDLRADKSTLEQQEYADRKQIDFGHIGSRLSASQISADCRDSFNLVYVVANQINSLIIACTWPVFANQSASPSMDARHPLFVK